MSDELYDGLLVRTSPELQYDTQWIERGLRAVLDEIGDRLVVCDEVFTHWNVCEFVRVDDLPRLVEIFQKAAVK